MKYIIIDDDLVFSERLAKALRSRGHQVSVANNSLDALALFNQSTNTSVFERAIIDLKMPDQNGLELLKWLSKNHPSVEALMLTGYGSIASAVDALKIGAKNFISKPADTDQILAAFEYQIENEVVNNNEIKSTSNVISTPTLARVEWEHISRVMQEFDGNITKAAKALKMHRRSLQRKLGKIPVHK